ncbi:uncharacterized protein LOC136074990 isoform X2 [Hydra vulgaris]|uniref:Uncharacterized protein LOC136074990 isoform X2 n=1 Tax=Hydra vulgaris TaxID=6087 RepID=A0ABM4B357_HYDVU
MSRNSLTSDELISRCCGKTSHKIGSVWLRWGRHLGLSDSDLYNIGCEKTKSYEKADNVLKKWKEKNGNFSWVQLKKELKAFERYDLVTDIEKEIRDNLYSQEKKRLSRNVKSLSGKKKKQKKKKKKVPVASDKRLKKSTENIIVVEESSYSTKTFLLLAILVIGLIISFYFPNFNCSFVLKNSRSGIQSFSENLFSRKKLLREIHDYFLQDSKKSTIVLYGMSGVGKTLIARKYCEISYNFYQNFVWIDAEFGMLQTSIRNHCQILGLQVHDSKGDYFDIKVIGDKIHNYYKNEKTLYIFDNVDDESVKNLSMYISRKPNSFTLITSQWKTWSNNVNKMLVDVFTSEEAFAYVKNNTKEKSHENIRNLIKELGYHPFAITQAIKYINIYKISIEKYIYLYKSKPSVILDNNNFPTEEESKSAIEAINLVLIKLEKTKPFLFKLLNCLSHCNGQNISKQFITKISNQMKINNESLIDEAIGLLISYSLLNCFDDNNYTIHELTQLTCKLFQKRNSSTNTYLNLIESYFKVELNEVNDHIDYGNHFVFHFIYMFRTNGKKFSETFHRMTTSIKKLLEPKGLFEEAIEILKSFQSFNAETYGENNKITLDTKHNIAICLNNMGKYNEAL